MIRRATSCDDRPMSDELRRRAPASRLTPLVLSLSPLLPVFKTEKTKTRRKRKKKKKKKKNSRPKTTSFWVSSQNRAPSFELPRITPKNFPQIPIHRKNMKMRNKGKVYPSPSSSSSSSMCFYTANRDALSVLKLLPTAILALVSILSVQDREVFAYMITRSIKSSNPSSILEEKKKSNKKSNTHKPPIFDCDCFDCYTSYWFRWDSSPNRELIHQAIEAFEEHLASGEKREKNGRGKRREKMGRRGNESTEVKREVVPPEVMEVVPEKGGEEEEEEEEEVVAPPEEAAVIRRSVAENNNHKGLVRKVLPDVVGILNSRLWSLWSPNV